MIRIITTPYGQLLADSDQEKGITVIRDSKNYQPIATIKATDRTSVLKAIRSLGSIMRMKTKLESYGVELAPGVTLVKEKPEKSTKVKAVA